MADKKQPNLRTKAWVLYDAIIREATVGGLSNPWHLDAESSQLRFVPDYETLKKLLAVPVVLSATSKSGVPAIALDVWSAFELRRAGFEQDLVWPRAQAPRILPSTLVQILATGTKKDRLAIDAMLASGKTFGGAIGASANILGKNYVKQVDVVISAWNTGPELLISTKRMDSSLGNNAANRVEESYGDSKNLRNRHPLAALGFLYVIRQAALRQSPSKAAWLLDLLEKLGNEDDAYDAVAVVVPEWGGGVLSDSYQDSDDEPRFAADGLEVPDDEIDESALAHDSDEYEIEAQLLELPKVDLIWDQVPEVLRPDRFFDVMVRRVLKNSPIDFHPGARARLLEAQSRKEVQ